MEQKIICETCGCWHQTQENEKDCGFCELFENIETHKNDECKLEEDEE